MKICIVCPRLCHGGAERVAVSLANGFVRRGHEVVFFADMYEEQTYILDEIVQVKNLVPKTNLKLIKWGSAIRLLRKQLKKEPPDVIIGIMSLCSVIAKLSSIGMGISVIATEHDSYERPASAPMPFLIYLYKFILCKLFSCVTVLTEADKEVVRNRLNNIVVMPNPLALEPIEMPPPRKKIILASGRVDNWHYKGFDVLIRAWGRVMANSKTEESILTNDTDSHNMKIETRNLKPGIRPFADWRLVIAGVWRNPETRVFLDGIAKECGVFDMIEYKGFVDDMQSLYAKSSIFVLSSRYEAFGLVLIEAMSQGCACIACDYKGRQREIISPTPALPSSEGEEYKGIEICDNGILCEPDNVDVLAEALTKMITDDEYRGSVRKNAIERSNYYSIENTMNRWEELLNRVINNHYNLHDSTKNTRRKRVPFLSAAYSITL